MTYAKGKHDLVRKLESVQVGQGHALAIKNLLLREQLDCATSLPLRLIEQNGKLIYFASAGFAPKEAKPMRIRSTFEAFIQRLR